MQNRLRTAFVALLGCWMLLSLTSTLSAQDMAQKQVLVLHSYHRSILWLIGVSLVSLVVVIMVLSLNILYRKRTDKTLKWTNARHSSMIANIGDVIGIIGPDGMIKYKSPNIERWFGWKPEDLVETDGWNTVHPADIERIQAEFFTLLENDEGLVTVEYRYKCKDDTYKWIELTAVNCTNNAAINGVLLNYHDITDRKQSEQALNETFERVSDTEKALRVSEAKFRGLFENMCIGCSIWKKQGHEYVLSDYNNAGEIMDSLKKGDILGKTIGDLFPDPTRRLNISQIFDSTLSSGKTEFMEANAYIVNDKQVWRDNYIYKLSDNEIVVVFNDITSRKQAEDELKDSQKFLDRIIEQSPYPTWISDTEGTMVRANPALKKVLNLTDEQLIGKYNVFQDPQVKEQGVLPAVHEALEQGKTTDYTLTWSGKDTADPNLRGSNLVHCEGTIFPIFDQKGAITHAVITYKDVTQRKKVEKQILTTQAQLKSLTSELVLAEERERGRLALYLHDEVCQNLAYSKMKLQMINAASHDWIGQTDLTDVIDTLDQTMRELRTLTFELTSPLLIEFGLEATIAEWLTEQIEQKHGIATTFADDGHAKPLEKDIQAMLFRSVRELLVNVVKHSQATHVAIIIRREKDQIVIHLEDDGIGFAPGDVEIGKDTGGFGLFSIRERLNHMGGSLEIDSSPDQGCRCIMRALLLQSEANVG